MDDDGAVAGVLSMEVLAHALSQKAEHHPDRVRPGRARAAGRGGGVLSAIVTWLPTIAQITFGDRKNAVNECPGNNGLCPSWILDHFHQYGTHSGSTSCWPSCRW